MRVLTASTIAAICGVLTGFSAISHAGNAWAADSCHVTVVTTDEDGKTDAAVRPQTRTCRPGEQDGDVEFYNPYTDTYRVVHDVPLEPLSPQGDKHSSGGTHTHGSTGGTTATNCTPAPRNGSKTNRAIVQTGHQQQRCSSTPANNAAQ